MAGKSKYNREFKLAIIAQTEAGESVTQVVRENGLSRTLVARWKGEYDTFEDALKNIGRFMKDVYNIK
jgi:transposase-like protein